PRRAGSFTLKRPASFCRLPSAVSQTQKTHATVGFPIKAEGQAFLLAASRISYWRCDATAITLLYTRFLSLDLVLRRKSESGDEEASGSLAPNSFMLNTPLR